MWATSNYAVDRNDPAFKEKALSLVTQDGTVSRADAEKVWSGGDTNLLGVSFLAQMGSAVAATHLSYLQGQWMHVAKDYVCRARDQNCIVFGKNKNEVLTLSDRRAKPYLKTFVQSFSTLNLLNFCQDLRAGIDPVLLQYRERAQKCDQSTGGHSTWASLEDYCESIATTVAELKKSL